MTTAIEETLSKPFYMAQILDIEQAKAATALSHLQLLRTFKMIEECAKASDYTTEINAATEMKTKMNEFSFTADVLHFTKMKSIDFSPTETKMNDFNFSSIKMKLNSIDFTKMKSFYTKINSFYILQNHFSPLFLFDKKGFETGDLTGYFSVDFSMKSIDFIKAQVDAMSQTVVYSYVKPQSDFLRLIEAAGGKLQMNTQDISKIKTKMNDFRFISFQFNDVYFSIHVSHFIALVKSNVIEFTEQSGRIYAHLSSDYWTKRSTRDYLNQSI